MHKGTKALATQASLEECVQGFNHLAAIEVAVADEGDARFAAIWILGFIQRVAEERGCLQDTYRIEEVFHLVYDNGCVVSRHACHADDLLG